MREIISLNKNWKFIEKEISYTEALKERGRSVDLPHTWNAYDGQDGGGDYKRASYFYRYDFKKPFLSLTDNDVYLEFKGVSQIATIYLNDKELFTHEGGFSCFRVNITEFIQDTNTLLVNVSNKNNDRVYPQFADFTFFGGIYRDVNMIFVPKCHFDLDYYGGPGLMVTPEVLKDKAKVVVNSFITNKEEGLEIVADLFDNQFNLIETKVSNINDPNFTFEIDKPVLWDGINNPYLYNVTLSIVKNDITIDSIGTDFGIRTFSIDPEKGFFLNGKSYPLRGVCRHQDRLNKGWAITKKEHKEDIDLIKEVGANTIRLAHYQQDQYMYDLCDQNGLCIWVEIPFISQFMKNGYDNTISQMKELVIQNYNHPSIITWGLSNEITMNGEEDPDLYQNHVDLNDLVHKLDKTRPTVMAQVSMLTIENKLNQLTDLRSYNIYYGWYGGEFIDNEKFIDEFHAKYPKLPLGISEYGAEANTKLHTNKPEQGDYTEEYQAMYHEHMLKCFEKRNFLWATHLWNMFDFAADSRDEGGTKGRNNKGLVTYDRKTRKDSFYLYKAYWSKTPFLHITSKRYKVRKDLEHTIKVYSNLDEVTLYLNNKLVESKKADKVFEFKVTLKKGFNSIKAISGSIKDNSVIVIKKKEPDSYSLNSKGAVKNWFEEEYEFKYPEGFYSINDKIGDIMETPEGNALFTNLMKKFSENPAAKAAGMKNPEKLMGMVKGFTLKRIASMAKGAFSAKDLFALNEELNKIKKK